MNNPIFKLQIKDIAWPGALAIFFLADRYLKYFAVSSWPINPKPIIGRLLTFNFVPNENIAFSLPLKGFWLTVLIGLIILAVAAYLVFNIKRLTRYEIYSFSAILLGATSNLIDRFKFGFVIDYLDLKWFTIFNLADSLIVFGTIYLCFNLLKKTDH